VGIVTKHLVPDVHGSMEASGFRYLEVEVALFGD